MGQIDEEKIREALRVKGLYPLHSLAVLESKLGVSRDILREVADTAGRYYRPFDFQRFGTDKWRHIDNPQGKLKQLQRAIQSRLLRLIPFPEMMFGGIARRSARDNAENHVGQPLLVTIDLKDCFPNTGNEKVFAAWIETFACSEEIASILTRLTTFQRRLPQGAPTSPLIENITLIPMYRDIERLAAELGLKFSFFVDDIAMSGARAAEALKALRRIVGNHNHMISWKKTRRMASGQSQSLTGATVNQKVSNGHDKLHRIREDILAVAGMGTVSYRWHQRIVGKISQAEHTDPTQGAALRRLLSRYSFRVEDKTGARRAKKGEQRPCSSFACHR